MDDVRARSHQEGHSRHALRLPAETAPPELPRGAANARQMNARTGALA